MENKDLINLFFQVLTLMGTMGAGFFGFWRFTSGKIDKHFEKITKNLEDHKKTTDSNILRVYDRMDEKCNLYVKDDLYQLELKHQRESLDLRFKAMMDFMEMKFDSLEASIGKLIKHDEDRGVK